MPISQSDQLFNLVKSLTAAEKRNFRQYAKRIQVNKDLMFLQLFDLLDKQREVNDSEVLFKLGNITRGQFSNVKRHLYSQIITSLRVLHKEKRANFKVREYIDFVYILYGKGLYLQSLKILNKAKQLALKNHLIYMQLILSELEKTIESRHITRSGSERAQTLIEESEAIQKDATHLVRLSNLRIRMHAKYLESGHVKSEEEAEEIREYYYKEIEPINPDVLGVMERIYYVQSRVWYNYILLDFRTCLQFAKEWIELLDAHPSMIERDVDLYLRGYHYVLTAATYIKESKLHSIYLRKIEHFRKSNYGKFNSNSQIISFLYVHTGRLDDIILNGTFERADQVIPKTVNRIRRYSYKGTSDNPFKYFIEYPLLKTKEYCQIFYPYVFSTRKIRPICLVWDRFNSF